MDIDHCLHDVSTIFLPEHAQTCFGETARVSQGTFKLWEVRSESTFPLEFIDPFHEDLSRIISFHEATEDDNRVGSFTKTLGVVIDIGW